MTAKVIKSFPRLWRLEAGNAMVVTDLHGDWEAYQRYRDRFIDLQAQGRADYLIFTGDLIHREGRAYEDKSVEILLDVIALQATYGQAVICLMGNHELPHIYGLTLRKGQRDYTPAFEAALTQSRRRPEIISFLTSLPFYLGTQAGVSVTHAGASVSLADAEQAQQLLQWSHRWLLGWADEALQGRGMEFMRNSYVNQHQLPYQFLAQHYLAVSGPDDPRYNDLVRGYVAGSHTLFQNLLWPALFTRCEEEYNSHADSSNIIKAVFNRFWKPDFGDALSYAQVLAAALQNLSIDFAPQRVLVAGHMPTRGGHEIVAGRHLRLASGVHATPRQAGQYLLFDVARPVDEAQDLLPCLGTVFG